MIRLALVLLLAFSTTPLLADTPESTRIDDHRQHLSQGQGGYPYREKVPYILRELDLRPGDVVVDVGAGDGFWAEKMAEAVGPTGKVYAGEVDEKKVAKLAETYADLPQLKPYLCPLDGTGLEPNTCDLAFFSKSYHHIDPDVHAAYWRHLGEVLKPTGRVCIIERHTGLSKGRNAEHAWPPEDLMKVAIENGWVPVRYELITGTYHYVAIFAQAELFPVEDPPQRPPRRQPAEATR